MAFPHPPASLPPWTIAAALVLGFLPFPARAELPKAEPGADRNRQTVTFYTLDSGDWSRGKRPTTSDVVLPNLNEILAPVPPPAAKQSPSPAKKASQQPTPSPAAHPTAPPAAAAAEAPRTDGSASPRFGFGSPQAGEAPTDPWEPVDPLTSPFPEESAEDAGKGRPDAAAPAASPSPVPVPPSALVVPTAEPSVIFTPPFFPRTFHYVTPCFPHPIVPYHGLAPVLPWSYRGYGIAPGATVWSGASLRRGGSCSGLRSRAVTFRFSF